MIGRLELVSVLIFQRHMVTDDRISSPGKRIRDFGLGRLARAPKARRTTVGFADALDRSLFHCIGFAVPIRLLPCAGGIRA